MIDLMSKEDQGTPIRNSASNIEPDIVSFPHATRTKETQNQQVITLPGRAEIYKVNHLPLPPEKEVEKCDINVKSQSELQLIDEGKTVENNPIKDQKLETLESLGA